MNKQIIKDNITLYQNRIEQCLKIISNNTEDVCRYESLLQDSLLALKKYEAVKVSDLPDGWYVIEGLKYENRKTPDEYVTMSNECIQKGDIIFIKNDMVYMVKHDRHHLNDSYNLMCIEGCPKENWYGYYAFPLNNPD